MTNKKFRFVISEGDPMALVRFDHVEPTLEHLLHLKNFSVKDGEVTWELHDEEGRVFKGRMGEETPLPYYPGAWVCVAIPVVMHRIRSPRKSIGIEFVISMPYTKQAHSLGYLKRKYPDLR